MQTLPKLGRILILALCCLLVLFMAVELAHTHTSAGPDAAHCPLCIAAHTAIHTVITLSASLTLALLGRISVGDASPGIRLVHSTQRIRPPPVDSRFSRLFMM